MHKFENTLNIDSFILTYISRFIPDLNYVHFKKESTLFSWQ